MIGRLFSGGRVSSSPNVPTSADAGAAQGKVKSSGDSIRSANDAAESSRGRKKRSGKKKGKNKHPVDSEEDRAESSEDKFYARDYGNNGPNSPSRIERSDNSDGEFEDCFESLNTSDPSPLAHGINESKGSSVQSSAASPDQTVSADPARTQIGGIDYRLANNTHGMTGHSVPGAALPDQTASSDPPGQNGASDSTIHTHKTHIPPASSVPPGRTGGRGSSSIVDKMRGWTGLSVQERVALPDQADTAVMSDPPGHIDGSETPPPTDVIDPATGPSGLSSASLLHQTAPSDPPGQTVSLALNVPCCPMLIVGTQDENKPHNYNTTDTSGDPIRHDSGALPDHVYKTADISSQNVGLAYIFVHSLMLEAMMQVEKKPPTPESETKSSTGSDIQEGNRPSVREEKTVLSDSPDKIVTNIFWAPVTQTRNENSAGTRTEQLTGPATQDPATSRDEEEDKTASHDATRLSRQDRIVVYVLICLMYTRGLICVVSLMGPTGAGKSTFIDYATRQNGASIGHTLSSQTSEIRAVRYMHPLDNSPVIFVDTPGFDDTHRSDIEILSQIAGWFVKVYKEKIPLAAIVYLHRISDNRMAGSPLKNLNMFASMCGQEAMPRVVLGTTMWSEVNASTGERRQRELKETFWADMIEQGCRMARFGDSFDSAWDMVGTLATQEDYAMIATEIVADKKRLNETAAGLKLNEELMKLIADQKEAARQLEEQAGRYDNPVLVEELRGRKKDIEKRLMNVTEQIHQLKTPWRRKFSNFFSGGKKARSSNIRTADRKGSL
ncbi:hypothetical protein HWV62_38919 [Athelia sp. TMB]|nr:hypothetical protein HWV62_38919 [Athelia sp. TMB]